MMTEQSLQKILDAANPNDAEDLAIRKFMVEQLRVRIRYPALATDGRSATMASAAAFPPAVAARGLGLGR
jgi:hypothetical protein